MSFLEAVKGSIIRHHPEPICPDCATWIAQETVILAANRLEAPDSPLCDCDGAPPDMRTQHTCDCSAVIAAARLLENLTTTLHAEQCTACK